MSLIDSAARPSSSSADLQGQGKAAICPPPRAKPRAKMDAVAKPRRYFEGGAGKRPGAAAKKAEAAAPRAGAAPASSPLRRQRPPLGALSGRMRDAGGVRVSKSKAPPQRQWVSAGARKTVFLAFLKGGEGQESGGPGGNRPTGPV